MHDLRLLRDGIDRLREGMRRRGALDELSPVLDRAVALDVQRRALIQAVEERKASRNAATQEVAKRRKAGEDAADIMAGSRVLGEEIARIEQDRATVEGELDRILLEIPNVTELDVPEGGEANNVVVREWGEPRPAESVRPHWEIGEQLGLLDLPRGAKVAGSGFPVFRARSARTRHVFVARPGLQARTRAAFSAFTNSTRSSS